MKISAVRKPDHLTQKAETPHSNTKLSINANSAMPKRLIQSTNIYPQTLVVAPIVLNKTIAVGAKSHTQNTGHVSNKYYSYFQ